MGLVLPVADIVEIQHTVAMVGHVLDNDEIDAFHLVFTDDVEIEYSQYGGGAIKGIATFQDMVRDADPAHRFDHLAVDTVVLGEDPDGTVRVRSRYIAMHADGRITDGEYLDRAKRTPDGWRL